MSAFFGISSPLYRVQGTRSILSVSEMALVRCKVSALESIELGFAAQYWGALAVPAARTLSVEMIGAESRSA